MGRWSLITSPNTPAFKLVNIKSIKRLDPSITRIFSWIIGVNTYLCSNSFNNLKPFESLTLFQNPTKFVCNPYYIIVP